MREILKKFENKQPEIVFEWSDSESEAEGWLVINSLRNGAAGGGTRMKKGIDKQDVIELAKTMEIKYTVSGPPIGGARSGINFDPKDPRKAEVLKRWYAVVMPILKSYCGTMGDLNVDERTEILPITEDYGLWHPQEGVVNGHYKAAEPEKIRKIGQLRQGMGKIIEDPKYAPDGTKRHTVSDMITGYGLAESIKHYYRLWGGKLKGKRAIIQGWGNVGASAACFLALEGVKIVGIHSLEGGLINTEGFSLEEVKTLFLNKENNRLVAENLIPYAEVSQRIWDVKADIFIPAAASRLITKEQVNRLLAGGVELITCGANIPFAEDDIFLGPIGIMADNKISLIPDFISNSGMARLNAYLMGEKAALTDQAIFEDISKTVAKALKRTHETNPQKTKIAQNALEIALNQVI
ncbi:Glu/Leu/Phe/Val dehydrogenase family protein [Lunatimonas lonarensis]|uniref:Glu/Leu/Phe/Val dehydrogenase family protein n=1 Tax=Lunatimonas lonarensis TaxID=1232681 RepID=R7ZYX0_9BACT|nr:Glu/Leu/Phe/Val dehydrogenase dimerization domain-containing protein [Lunatimonas lonarensis]EON79292.1 Glu/Leu/Phe/Val dehydrogenase family protein [Lunatimonas lonarensis]